MKNRSVSRVGKYDQNRLHKYLKSQKGNLKNFYYLCFYNYDTPWPRQLIEEIIYCT